MERLSHTSRSLAPRVFGVHLALVVGLLIAVWWTWAPHTALSDPSGSLFAANGNDKPLLHAIRTREPRSCEVIGHSSVALRLELDGSLLAVYKMASRAFPRAHVSEVAAYRLSTLLGFDNVPPATLRQLSATRIDALVREASKAKWESVRSEVLWSKEDRARGAVSAWVHDLGSLRLEQRQAWWRAWLGTDKKIPKRWRALARDLSNMVAFDYLIDNPDRFSGQNMKVVRRGKRFVMLDHDQAFPEVSSEESHSVFLLKSLELTERFSRKFIDRLRKIDEPTLTRELATAPHALLDGKQVRSLMRRRDTLLAHVSRLEEKLGQNAVLFFD